MPQGCEPCDALTALVYSGSNGFLKGYVGENKRLKKQLEGLQLQVDLHNRKIADELRKGNPDRGLIEHWQKEVDIWHTQIQKKKERLKRKR